MNSRAIYWLLALLLSTAVLVVAHQHGDFPVAMVGAFCTLTSAALFLDSIEDDDDPWRFA